MLFVISEMFKVIFLGSIGEVFSDKTELMRLNFGLIESNSSLVSRNISVSSFFFGIFLDGLFSYYYAFIVNFCCICYVVMANRVSHWLKLVDYAMLASVQFPCCSSVNKLNSFFTKYSFGNLLLYWTMKCLVLGSSMQKFANLSHLQGVQGLASSACRKRKSLYQVAPVLLHHHWLFLWSPFMWLNIFQRFFFILFKLSLYLLANP